MPQFNHLKVLPFELEKAEKVTPEEGKGGRPRLKISGWASTNTPDRSKEVIDVGFFDSTLDKFMRTASMPWMHNLDDPQGRWESITPVEGKGYYVTGHVLDLGTELDRRRMAMIEEGLVRSLSVGFSGEYTPEYGDLDEDGTWHWRSGGELYEVSLCTVPCNPDTSFELAKKLGIELSHYEPPAAEEPAAPEDPEEAEQRRFIEDLERCFTKAESIRNITRHWQKEGRVLTAEHRQRVAEVQAFLSELLETHPAPLQEPAPQEGLFLPKVATLGLPEVSALTLPG